MNFLPLYLRIFNFMVRRVVASVFIVVGGLGALLGIPTLFDPSGAILVNGVAQSSLFYRILAVAAPGVMAILGILLFRAPPFSFTSALVKPNKSLERTRDR